MTRRPAGGGKHKHYVYYTHRDGTRVPLTGQGGKHRGGICGLFALAMLALPVLLGIGAVALVR